MAGAFRAAVRVVGVDAAAVLPAARLAAVPLAAVVEALFRACLAATRPTAPGRRHTVPIVLTYDNGTAHWGRESEAFHPNVYVDISDYVDVKLKALALHASQLHGVPARAGLTALMHLYGEQVAVGAAEAFQALRVVL